MRLNLRNPLAHASARRRLMRAALGLGAFAMLTLPVGVAGAQGPGSTATVRFGNPTAGSPFPTGPGTIPHDESVNAKDNMIPRQVVIAPGGSVTFQIPSAHQPAVYLPDSNPVPMTGNRVNDPNRRIFLETITPPTTIGTPRDVTVTFPTTPGRYLVICNIRAHYETGMTGWVTVQ